MKMLYTSTDGRIVILHHGMVGVDGGESLKYSEQGIISKGIGGIINPLDVSQRNYLHQAAL